MLRTCCVCVMSMLSCARAGKGGWTLIDKLADFQLLLYLSQYLDLDGDLPCICQSVLQRDVPLSDGYQLIIRSIAGLS